MAQDEFAPKRTVLVDGCMGPEEVLVPVTVFSSDRNGFMEIANEIIAIHAKKSKDYGTDENPLANIRASEEFATPAWVGAMIRANDKVTRIKSVIKNGRLENESLEDSLLDLATYTMISLQLFRELKSKPKTDLASKLKKLTIEAWINVHEDGSAYLYRSPREADGLGGSKHRFARKRIKFTVAKGDME